MAYQGALRTNFRITQNTELADSIIGGSALQGTAIGGGIVAGSFLPAAAGGIGGASNLYGGFVVGSFASQLSGVGFLQVSAIQALSAFYGTVPGAAGSGYKFIPLIFQDFSGDGVSSPVFYHLTATGALATVTSIAIIAVNKASQTTGSGVMFTSASNISVHFLYAGWIVSVP